jgi:ketosteroid isomerase-like protein
VETGISQTDQLALARQVFGWFQQHDTDAFLGALHPNVHARPSISGSPDLHGRGEVALWWNGLAADGADLEARPLDFEERGDCVLVRGYLRHREGRTLAESQVFWLCQFRDGMIVRMESYTSRSAALAAC